MADRAEIDSVVEPQSIEPVFRHHPACFGIAFAAPVEVVPGKLETIGTGRRFHCRDALRHHLVPDAVSRDYRDSITLRHVHLHAIAELSANRRRGNPVPLRRQLSAVRPQWMSVVERPMAAAETRRAGDRALNIVTSAVDRAFDPETLGEAGCNRRGEGTAGAVS